MKVTSAFKWALLYRALATVAFLVGLGLVAAGIVLGVGDALTALFQDPTDPGPALGRMNPLPFVALTVVGLVVWQFGKATALFLTMPKASGRRAADAFDANRIRSEVLEALDDRLTDMETEIRETRRSVQELERTEHATTFDESAVDGTDQGSAGAEEATRAAAADEGQGAGSEAVWDGESDAGADTDTDGRDADFDDT